MLAEDPRVHLRPEQLPRFWIERVVEGVRVAAVTDPVAQPLGEIEVEKETLRAHRLEGLRAGVVLPPHRDHQVSVARVDVADPPVRIGKARRIELLRAPGVLLPVEPVLHDGVERDAALAEPVDDVEALFRGFVALPALPQPHRPARDHRRRPGDAPVAGDDAVQLGAVDEVVVDAVAHLRPERGRGWGCRRRFPEQLHSLHVLVLAPLEPELGAMPRLEPNARHLLPRQPPLAPVVDDQLVVDPHLDAAVGEGLELVVARRLADRPRPSSARWRSPRGAPRR